MICAWPREAVSAINDLVARGELSSPTAVAAFESLEQRAAQLEELVRLALRRAELERERADLEHERAEMLEELCRRLEADKDDLETRLRDVEARLELDSTNSSKPPSSDPPQAKPKRRSKRRSGKKRGGQRGHAGAHRSLVPGERVDEMIEHRPDACRHCHASLEGAPTVGAPGRHQVTELPEVRAHITEHRTLTCVCPRCQRRTKAPLPAELRGKHFGPRLVAFSAMLMSRFRMSRRQLAAFLGDLLDVEPPALGTTQAFADEVRGALLEPYREIRRAVRRSDVVGADETGWRLRELRRWLWVAVSKTATLFRFGRRRGAADVRALRGRAFGGILVTDRWSAYNGHPDERRQFCWAHLKRNFQGVAERGGPGARLGELGVAECRRLFGAHGRYAAGLVTHAELVRELAPVRARFARLLRRGAASEDRKARALSRDLLRRWPSLWTFLRHKGVPPTNNASERAIRGPVIHRKLSFGSKRGKGLRFLERIFSVAETCRMHERSILDYLTKVMVAHRAGAPTPRVLTTR